ncbi:MAG: hypothetical protein JW760_05975 [Spirochaetales bacterium]|nr:hypothetical protein [Spirochaetales bacterium]
MRKAFCLGLLMAGLVFRVFSANILVPSLELVTRGYMDNGSFALSTRGDLDLLVEGGYKFGGQVILNIESEELHDLSDSSALGFKSAAIQLRNLFSIPLDLTWFAGEYDNLCTGDLFPVFFGTGRIASRFGGYMYFPEGVQYEGIHQVAGTGVKLETTFGSESNRTGFYIYQDSFLGTGHFSADFWTIQNFRSFKLESFIGASFPASVYGYYRAGLLLYYQAGNTGEFLTQVGIPRWDPVNDPMQIDLFYFLFEPRVHLGLLSIIMTLFWHPEYYHQVQTNELGSVDVNVNFQLGNPDVNIYSGGIETNLSFLTYLDQQFKAGISPYFSAITSGVIWDFKVNVKLFPFDLSDLAEGYIGIRAEF